MKKGKILTVLCLGVLVCGGFFLSQNVNVANNYSTQNMSSQTEINSANVISENSDQNTQTINIAYNVILVDFNDQTCINGRLNYTLDNYIDTYSKVTEYIYELSNHKVNMVFNYYNYKIDANASEVTHKQTRECTEFVAQYYDDVLANKQSLQINGYNGNLNIFQFASTYSIQYTEYAWPCYYSFISNDSSIENAIRLIDETNSLTILHEIMHSFGLHDLYSNSNSDCSLSYDTLSCRYGLYPTVNAYMRESLNWISSSSYDDEQQTEIEYINESGRYRLYYPNNLNQTIAYSFGNRNKETFYIEARTKSDNNTVLVINRVNDAVAKNNLTATNKNQCYISDIAEINNSNIIISDDGTPNAKNVIYYANGDYANYAIRNVTFSNNYLEFDFSTNGNFDFLLEINAVDTANNKLADAQVYVNDTYAGTTNTNGILTCKVGEGDVITVLNPYTKNPQTYTVVDGITSKNFVFDAVKKSNNESTGNTNVVPGNYDSISLAYTLSISLVQEIEKDSSLLNYYYLDNSIVNNSNIQVYVDNSLVEPNYNGYYSINLKNNSNILICSNNQTVCYIFDSSSKTLRNSMGGSRVYCQNNTFSVTLTIPTVKYSLYVTVVDNEDKRIGITGMLAYNATTGSWEELSCISDYTECYPMTVYLTSEYTAIYLEYQNWFENGSVCFDISPTQRSLLIPLEQNIFQSGLDWWSNLFK